MEVIDNNVPETTTAAPKNVLPNVPPKTWLVESILVTIFCCLPFGIVGIVNATKVESLFYAGQLEASQRASRDAGKWTKIGFWVGLGCGLLYIILWVVLMAMGIAADSFNF